jgi:signal transduction histidine kinase/CheY-like chemotaxis protein
VPNGVPLVRALVVALLLFSLVPVAIAAVFSFTQLQGVVHQQTENTIRVAADLAQVAVVQLLNYLKARTLDVAADWYIEERLAGGRAGRELDRYLGINRSHIPESREIFVVSPAGRVIASSDSSSIGRDDSGTDYFRGGHEGVYVGDVGRDADGAVRWVVAAPIVDRQSGAFLGVLGNRIGPRVLSDLTSGRRLLQLGGVADSLRRGLTGEVYIVNRDGLMLTESRFNRGDILGTRVDTSPVTIARTEERASFGDYADYRGVRVTGASALVPQMGWIVVAEVDAAEAQAPIHRLRTGLALLGLGLVPAVALFGLLLRHGIARPIRLFIAANERAASEGAVAGFLAERSVPYVEWRRLVAGRNAMLTRLEEQSAQLRQQLDRERVYREAQEAGRRKDRFLAMLAHELRSPLGAISNAIHVLDGLPAGDARQAHLSAIVGRQTRHLARLVEDLLDVSRIGAGKIVLRPRRVDLRDVARSAVETAEAAGRSWRHTVELALPAEPMPVHGDPARLEQIVRNLLDNAAKYSADATTIHVTVAREGDAVIRVKDEGVGIAPDDLAAIFEPFAQSEASLEHARGGLGLGLALVRGLVELHHGRVTAHSGGPGLGSEFVVRLPLASPADEPGDPGGGEAAGAPLHILVVEDEPDARDALQAVLETDGHHVDVAGDGREAVKLARERHPEVALVDLGLPGLDGFEVARTIRATAAGATIRLIAVSGHGQPEDQQRSLDSGFETHLVKPVDVDQLRRALGGKAA